MNISLSQGLVCTIDEDDFPLVGTRSWWANRCAGQKVYAVTKIAGRLVYMHRLLTGAPKGMVVDHIDGDTLNNARPNLRICAQYQNIAASKAQIGASGYRGVFSSGTRWRARVKAAGKYYEAGIFDDAADAARARDALAVRLLGSFAQLNFAPGA